jgi:hypothetical protein
MRKFESGRGRTKLPMIRLGEPAAHPAAVPGLGCDKMASRSSAEMTHAIIRGKNGRRCEVDFGDSLVRIEVHASEETVEIFVKPDFETHAEERRRFAIMNIPRHLFSEATGIAVADWPATAINLAASMI